MRTAQIRCVGRVQGVFYRASTSEEARRLGLKGWVRNEGNGDVLIYVQGADEEIKKLISWCEDGPPLSKVDHVEVSWIESDSLYQSFEVAY